MTKSGSTPQDSPTYLPTDKVGPNNSLPGVERSYYHPKVLTAANNDFHKMSKRVVKRPGTMSG